VRSKNGVAAREVERKYEPDRKSAWFMLHRIREAMKLEPLAGLLGGAIQVDETWIGGKPSNRPKRQAARAQALGGPQDRQASRHCTD
jgi:hypothetical protein